MKSKKINYYLAEVQKNAGFKTRKARKLNADNITSAKIEARRNQCFEGTDLIIGSEIDDDGYLKNVLYSFRRGYWNNLIIVI